MALRDAWAEGPRTYPGLQVAGFGELQQRVLAGFRQQAAQVEVGVRAVIQRAFREDDPLRPSAAVTAPARATIPTTSEEVSRQRGRSIDQLRRELTGDLDNIVLMAMHCTDHVPVMPNRS